MIPADQQVKVTSNMEGQKIGMKIAEGAEQHFMRLFTDLYANPLAAVVREYSTNARDSHIAAGTMRPIEVTYPTGRFAEQVLTIQDYGLGLSVEDVESIYSQYGASTKRGSNDYNGMLGLGCKSALTYAEQFTVTAVKDGVRIMVMVSRDSNGVPSMTVVDTSRSDDHNGVRVQVPLKQNHNIAQVTADLYQYWPEGSVLVNGEAPERIDGVWLDDTIVVRKCEYRYGTRRHQGVIVMGNVGYPAALPESMTVSQEHEIVAFVETGAVDFTPAREALMTTPRTNKTLEEIADRYARLRHDAVQKAIDAESVPADAIRAMIDTSRALAVNLDALWARGMTWRGKALPTPIENGPSGLETIRRGGYYRTKTTNYARWPARSWPSSVFIYNYTDKTFSGSKLDRMLQATKGLNLDQNDTFVLLKDKPVSEFIDPARCLDWEDVRKIKVDGTISGTRATKKIAGSYKALVNGTMHAEYESDKIDTAHPVLTTHDLAYAYKVARNLVALSIDKYTIVYLPANRRNKFMRDFPQAKEARTFVEKRAKAWFDGLPASRREAISLRYCASDVRDALARLNPVRVNDPDLRDQISGTKLDVTKELATIRTLRYAVTIPQPQFQLQDKYPLIPTGVRPVDAEHIYLYANAVYAANQKGA